MNTAPALIHHWDFLLIMNPKDRTFDDNAGDSHTIKWLGQKQKKETAATVDCLTTKQQMRADNQSYKHWHSIVLCGEGKRQTQITFHYDILPPLDTERVRYIKNKQTKKTVYCIVIDTKTARYWHVRVASADKVGDLRDCDKGQSSVSFPSIQVHTVTFPLDIRFKKWGVTNDGSLQLWQNRITNQGTHFKRTQMFPSSTNGFQRGSYSHFMEINFLCLLSFMHATDMQSWSFCPHLGLVLFLKLYNFTCMLCVSQNSHILCYFLFLIFFSSSRLWFLEGGLQRWLLII